MSRLFLVSLCGMALTFIAGAGSAQVPPGFADVPLRFEIRGYRVSGSGLLGEAEIQALVAPFSGKERGFGDIQQALKAIRDAYAAIGYRGVKVALPEQELGDGVVSIVVTETTVEAVEVSGNVHFASGLLRGQFPMLAEGKPIDFGRLGQALDVVNENPAMKALVELAPGSGEPTRRAKIVVQDENPFSGFAALDDSGSSATGKHRLGVGLRHADVGGMGHVLTAQYSVSAEKSSAVSYWGAGYRVPMAGHGMALDFYAGHSDVNSGTIAGLFDVAGTGTLGGAKATWQLNRIGAYRHRLAAGIDYRQFDNKVVLAGGTRSLVPDYTVHPFSLAYAGDFERSSFAVSAVRGFRGGANSDSATLSQVRFGADANYSLLRYAASHVLQLGGDWSAQFGVSGQQTRDPLVPGEQFGLGGAQSVRGFDERYIAGDSGLRASVEARTPQGQFGALLLTGVGFVDYGELRRNMVQPGELERESIAALGVGVRLLAGKQFSLALDFARALHGTASHPAGSGRAHLSIQASF